MRAPVLLALAAALAACSARRHGGEDWPRKVVLFCPAERQPDAESIARELAAVGDYRTFVEVTPIRRERSSCAVYGLREHPERVTDMSEFLRELGEEIEVLPFQQRGSGGNTVVIWLAAKAP